MSSPTIAPLTPTHQTPIDHGPAISELVHERPLHLADTSTRCTDDLYDSRHNEDFRTRNHRKVLQVETWLADFATLLRSAARLEDQQAFVDLYKRLRAVAEGLIQHSQKPSDALDLVVEKESPVRVREGDFWKVRHPAVEDETPFSVEETVAREKRMTEKARWARVKWEREADEKEKRWVEGGEPGCLDDFEDDWAVEEWKELIVGSGETTLVDDVADIEKEVAAVNIGC